MTDFTKLSRKDLEDRAKMYQREFVASEAKVEKLEEQLRDYNEMVANGDAE